jgi:protein-S-isoprenylcysteine O-methyltransferase Ste14
LTAVWCVLHSLFVTHWWRRFLRRHFPRRHVFDRLAYVTGSTVSLGVLMWWLRGLPATTLFDWPGWWAPLRWLGLAAALLMFYLGARGYDGRFFLGLSQVRHFLQGNAAGEPPFRTEGVLGHIRHPWYTGAILFLICCLPVTDVNLVWRGVFVAYTVIGTELEERKLLRDLGEPYAAYRQRVPRFFPAWRRLLRPEKRG